MMAQSWQNNGPGFLLDITGTHSNILGARLDIPGPLQGGRTRWRVRFMMTQSWQNNGLGFLLDILGPLRDITAPLLDITGSLLDILGCRLDIPGSRLDIIGPFGGGRTS